MLKIREFTSGNIFGFHILYLNFFSLTVDFSLTGLLFSLSCLCLCGVRGRLPFGKWKS